MEMTFTDNDRARLKENKQAIIDWIKLNIVPFIDDDSKIECDFGGTYRCPRTGRSVDNYHFYVYGKEREFYSGGGHRTKGTIGFGEKFGYMSESFESVNSPYDIYLVVNNWKFIKRTLLDGVAAQERNRKSIYEFEV